MKLMAVLGKVFSCVWWLMGLEGLSEALADDPDLVARMFDRVGKFQYRVFERMLEHDAVGALWHADDIAFATQLMVSPTVLRANHVSLVQGDGAGRARARSALGLPQRRRAPAR